MTDRDLRADLETIFPRLRDSGYIPTSPYEDSYNCVAYIAGDQRRRWEPERRGGWYWPPELPLEDFSLDNYLRCFEVIGFRGCDDGSLVDGVEKIAVFVDEEGEFSHVARQLSDGWWSSKLGAYEDISHETLEVLFQGRPYAYGEDLRFMQRDRRQPGPGRSGLILPSR